MQQCDGDLIELLGKLQLNGFLKALKAAEKDKFDPDAVYGDFMKYHSEFIAIYEELKRYAEGYKIRYLSPLTEKEIGQYFRELYEDTCRDKGTVCVLIDSTDVRWDEMSKLANEIFDFLKLCGSILVAEKWYLKWVLMTCLFDVLDATWNKLHLKRFLGQIQEK